MTFSKIQKISKFFRFFTRHTTRHHAEHYAHFNPPSLVPIINSHLFLLIRGKKFWYRQEICHISSKTTHSGLIH